MMTKAQIALAASLALVALVQSGCCAPQAQLPGAQTAAGVAASSLDGMSRYLAPDGPIQPGITAIGGLPMRGAELANNGLTSVSSRLNQGAQGLSRAAGQSGQIRMPGLDSIRSNMPEPVANLANMLGGAIRQKNNFIRGQAESGIQSANRLQSMMQNGLQSTPFNGRQLANGQLNPQQMAQTLSQLPQQGAQALNQIGQSMGEQARGLARNLSNGRLSNGNGPISDIGNRLNGAAQQASSQLQQASGQLQQAIRGPLQSASSSINSALGN